MCLGVTKQEPRAVQTMLCCCPFFIFLLFVGDLWSKSFSRRVVPPVTCWVFVFPRNFIYMKKQLFIASNIMVDIYLLEGWIVNIIAVVPLFNFLLKNKQKKSTAAQIFPFFYSEWTEGVTVRIPSSEYCNTSYICIVYSGVRENKCVNEYSDVLVGKYVRGRAREKHHHWSGGRVFASKWWPVRNTVRWFVVCAQKPSHSLLRFPFLASPEIRPASWALLSSSFPCPALSMTTLTTSYQVYCIAIYIYPP